MERKDYVVHRSFEKGFPLSNCVLYRLGWYYRTDDFWGDLRKCIEADGYLGRIMSKWEMVKLLLAVAEDWNYYAANKGYNLIRISALLVSKWEVDGFKKFDSENPELVAIASTLLNIFALDYNRLQLPLKKPHYSKKNPLKPTGYKHGETYTQANKHVETFTNWA